MTATHMPKPATRALVGLLLLVHAALALTAISRRGFAMDEIDHLTMGMSEWVTHDYRVDTANGDLIKRWASLPLLATGARFPGGPRDPAWRGADYFRLGGEFFFRSGNDPDRMLLAGRSMAVLLSVALGLLVFSASRRLFGTAGGLLSLLLYALCPVMLAHAAMVTTDLSLAFTLSAATAAVWRLLHRVTWGALALGGAAVGLLFLAKLTAVLIVPIAGALLALRLARNEPWRVELGGVPRALTGRGRQLLLAAGLLAFHAAAAAAFIWAHYEFRFAGSSAPADTGLAWTEVPADARPISPPLRATIDFLLVHRLLPEGFLRGAHAMLILNRGRLAFMRGHWSSSGWHAFFPYAFAIKTPLFLFAVLGLGAWAWLRSPERRRILYQASPWWVLPCAVMLAASLQHVNIGHRHILAVYPALYILAGSAALGLGASPRWRWALGAAVLGFTATSLRARPDYLAYVNVLGGGMENGYRDLVDGSEDWGLGLPQLRRWLDGHDPGDAVPSFLAYRGMDSPEYRGLRCRNLFAALDRRGAVLDLEPGYYCVSASVLEGVTYAAGPWNSTYEAEYRNACRLMADASALPRQGRERAYAELSMPFASLRVARLCAWLRRPQAPAPAAFVGHAILVWRLSGKDLSDALDGPVPEDDAAREAFLRSPGP